MKLRFLVLVVAGATAVFGCDSTTLVTSTALTCAKDQCQGGSGFVYSLPKVQFVVTATRTAPAASDLTAAASALAGAADKLGAAQTALATAQKQVLTDTLKMSADQEKKMIDTAKTPPDTATIQADQDILDSDSETIKLDKIAVTSAKSTVSIYAQLATIAQNTLDKQQILQIEGNETATLTAQPIAADTSTRYVAALDHKQTRDDTDKLSVVNGLLTSASATSTDQTLAVATSLINSVTSVVAFAVSGVPLVPAEGGHVAAAEQNVFPPDCPYSVSEAFDPLDANDVKRVNDLLQKTYASSFRIYVRVGTTEISDKESIVAPPANADGFVYRVPVPVAVTVRAPKPPTAHCPLQTSATGQGVVAVIPDTRSNYTIAADADAFTNTQLGYAFSNGMLTDFSATRPSQLVAVAAVPVDIANQILSIPGSIFKLRLDYTNNVDAQTKADTALATDTAALAAAQNPAKPAAPATGK